ncbi:hypothetical protein IGA67_30790, partial [Pseudomonas aeruginosa]|nr:hypothetical protein [Pseudomonas aeruginosa]
MLSSGPLSDRYGRKLTWLLGVGLFSFGSLLCALAGIVESLGKDRQRAGYQQRPGDALDRASEQQQRQRGGQRA